jgi:hypothetical protein
MVIIPEFLVINLIIMVSNKILLHFSSIFSGVQTKSDTDLTLKESLQAEPLDEEANTCVFLDLSKNFLLFDSEKIECFFKFSIFLGQM